jgi:hypothetical protein
MIEPSDEQDQVYMNARKYLREYLQRKLPTSPGFYPELMDPNFPLAANSFVMMKSQEKLSAQNLRIQESNRKLQRYLTLFAAITVVVTVANVLISLLR